MSNPRRMVPKMTRFNGQHRIGKNVQFWAERSSGITYFSSREIRKLLVSTFLGKERDWFVEQIANLHVWGINTIVVAVPPNENIFIVSKEGLDDSVLIFASERLEQDVENVQKWYLGMEITILLPISTEYMMFVGNQSFPVLSFIFLSKQDYDDYVSELNFGV